MFDKKVSNEMNLQSVLIFDTLGASRKQLTEHPIREKKCSTFTWTSYRRCEILGLISFLIFSPERGDQVSGSDGKQYLRETCR